MSASEFKFLVDVGVGKKVEEYLLGKSYDTKAVRSLDHRMPDHEIIRYISFHPTLPP
jgi:hypothetical protein